MKRTLISAMLFFALVSTDCRKRPFDDRNKYTGNWIFQYHVIVNQLGQPTEDDAGTFTGRIFYNGKDDAKGVLWFEYAEGKTEKFELKNKTELYGCGEKNGQFDSRNSLTVISVPVHVCNYGLAGKTSFTITADRAN